MSQFNSITPDFRDALLALADKIALEKVGPTPEVTVKVSMSVQDDDIEIISDEGTSATDIK